jgi:hypothetical protein
VGSIPAFPTILERIVMDIEVRAVIQGLGYLDGIVRFDDDEVKSASVISTSLFEDSDRKKSDIKESLIRIAEVARKELLK